jgi:hypothetical protein
MLGYGVGGSLSRWGAGYGVHDLVDRRRRHSHQHHLRHARMVDVPRRVMNESQLDVFLCICQFQKWRAK